MDFNFDKEIRKFKRKMKTFSKDFEELMGKGEEVGKKYGHEAKKKLHELKSDVSEHWNDMMMRHDITGKFKHAMDHIKLMSDVHDKGRYIAINVSLPGVEKKDVMLKITNTHVEVKAHRREHAEVRRKGSYRKAVHEKYFERLIPLPSHVQHEKAKARFKEGLLTIIIPKKKVDRKLGLR